MPHWRSMTDRDYLYAYDLQGRDVTVTIEKVVAGELTSTGGKKTKKPIVSFVGKAKPLALNATNAKTIAAMYGNHTEAWIGKAITIWPTTTSMGGETVECIRIRPTVPKQNGKPAPKPPADPDTWTPPPPPDDEGSP